MSNDHYECTQFERNRFVNVRTMIIAYSLPRTSSAQSQCIHGSGSSFLITLNEGQFHKHSSTGSQLFFIEKEIT